MTLHNALRLSVLVCCLLGFMIFAIAEGAPLGLIVLVLGGLSGWWVTDGRRIVERENDKPWRGLPRWVSNLLLFAVIVIAALGAWRTRSLVSTFAILLACVMLLKLWQERRPRDYAQLLTMSLFLTVGATLSDITLPTGLLVIIQIPAMLAATMLYHVWSTEHAAHRTSTHGRQPTRDDLRRQWKRLRLPFAVVGVLTLVVGSAVAVGVFLAMPRGVMLYQFLPLPRPNVGRVGGYVEEVDLAQSGLISESRVIMMEAEVSGLLPPQPLGSPDIPIYLRGAVLDQYRNGKWATSPPSPSEVLLATLDAGRSLDHPYGELGSRLLRVTPRLRSLAGKSPAFSLDRPWRWEFQSGADIRLDKRTSTLSYAPLGPFDSYDVYTTTAPDTSAVSRRGSVSFDDPRVREIADQILKRAEIDPDPAVRPVEQDTLAARAFESYLRGARSYTLDPPVPPVGEDPTAWFLTRGESGHCEFFASGLAAMCRSVGIDARVAAGYLTSEFDLRAGSRGGGAYIVRASDAHAWVEVNTAPGVWRTYDATPAFDGVFRRQQRTFVGGWLDRLFSGAQNAWNTSIVSFDRSAQQRIFGGSGAQPPPWVERVTSLLHPRYRAAELRSLRASLAQWWPLGLGALAVVAVFMLWRRLARRGPVRARNGGISALDNAPPAARALHADILRTFRKLGIQRQPGTPLRACLIHTPTPPSLHHAVDLLYDSCFGGRTDEAALRRARQALRRARG